MPEIPGWRFEGAGVHPNGVGMLTVGMAISGLYLLCTAKAVIWKVISVTAVGLSIFVLVLSGSRTSMVSIAAAVCVFAVYLFRSRYSGAASRVAPKRGVKRVILPLALSCVVVVIALIVIATRGGYINIPALQRFIPSDQGMDGFLSGRVSVWEQALSLLDMTGVNPHTAPLIDIGGAALSSAHNIPLDLAYRAGIPAGIAGLAFGIIAFIILVKLLLYAGSRDRYYLFTAMFVSAYLVYSLSEITVQPFEYAYSFCFFIGLGPLIMNRQGYGKKLI
jgi:O-antigen ligase